MSKVVLGFGPSKGYRLEEVSQDVLKSLADRYPLEVQHYDPSDGLLLMITVAVHEEIQRRANGGQIWLHVPSRRELAQGIVREGFRQLSKKHHPDRNGHEEAQKTLAAVRDELQRFCAGIRDDFDDDTFFVPDSEPDTDDFPDNSSPVTDDDVPF